MQDIKLTMVWLILISLTLAMFILSQYGLEQQLLITMMLVAAWFKGQLIIDHFMGLRYVAVKWRLFISLWLVTVLSIIFSVYTWLS